MLFTTKRLFYEVNPQAFQFDKTLFVKKQEKGKQAKIYQQPEETIGS